MQRVADLSCKQARVGFDSPWLHQTGDTMDDEKRVEIPLFEVYDNPCVSLVTGEFTNVLPDGSPGASGDVYKEVLEILANHIKRDRTRDSASSETATSTR